MKSDPENLSLEETAADETPLEESIVNYLGNKQRLKAMGVLGSTLVGTILFKEQVPDIAEYFQHLVPWLSNELISFGVNTSTYTACAPLGFLVSNYANNEEVRKKELLGQVAFSAGWSVLRHYCYGEMSSFDEVTAENTLLKLGTYTAYYALAVSAYRGFSEYWHNVCDGMKTSEALGSVKGGLSKLRDLAKDPNMQYNLALNLVNMFNPWTESRPTLAAIGTIHQNMSIVKHSHKRKHGFFSYIKDIVLGKNDHYKTEGS